MSTCEFGSLNYYYFYRFIGTFIIILPICWHIIIIFTDLLALLLLFYRFVGTLLLFLPIYWHFYYYFTDLLAHYYFTDLLAHLLLFYRFVVDT